LKLVLFAPGSIDKVQPNSPLPFPSFSSIPFLPLVQRTKIFVDWLITLFPVVNIGFQTARRSDSPLTFSFSPPLYFPFPSSEIPVVSLDFSGDHSGPTSGSVSIFPLLSFKAATFFLVCFLSFGPPEEICPREISHEDFFSSDPEPGQSGRVLSFPPAFSSHLPSLADPLPISAYRDVFSPPPVRRSGDP